MGETKPKQADNLRTPKPKKTLGLSVPPALRLPHEDFIQQLTPPSQSSQTSHPSQSKFPISPIKDFTKVANSIHREAIPEGLFVGKSKQLYDCLYALTRGAITPARQVRISRPKLMKKAGIGSRVTFDTNVARLISVGLLDVTSIAGEHEGNEFTVYLPGEKSVTGQASQTSQSSETSHAQNPVRVVIPESSQTRHTLIVENKGSEALPNTSSKTTTKSDDEAFAQLILVFKDLTRKLTGKQVSAADVDRWRELAEVIGGEAVRAASHTTVSNVPAFLAEHMKRRLSKEEKPMKSVKPDVVGKSEVPSAQPMSDAERSEVVQMIIEMISSGGYMLEQAEAQFGAGLRPEDWSAIRAQVEGQGSENQD